MGLIRRLRVTRGFTVHSPFAYYFIRRVLRERCRFYCFDHEVRRRRERMLFRVVNYLQPSTVCVLGAESTARALEVMRLARHDIVLVDNPYDADIVYAAPDAGELPVDCAALFAPSSPAALRRRLIDRTTLGMTFAAGRTLIAVNRRGLPRQHWPLLP